MKTIAIALALFLGAATVAQARQYVVYTAGRTRVVHTRLAPVIIHRVFPPYTGIHIHQSELPRR